MATPIVAVIIRREHEVIAAFRGAGATSRATALPLHSLCIDDGSGFRHLLAQAVIHEAHPGTFYLDEATLSAVRAIRRRIMLVMGAVLIVIAATVALHTIALS